MRLGALNLGTRRYTNLLGKVRFVHEQPTLLLSARSKVEGSIHGELCSFFQLVDLMMRGFAIKIVVFPLVVFTGFVV